jgi:hypothetical protein
MNTVLPRWYGLRDALMRLDAMNETAAPVSKIVDGCEDIRNNRSTVTTLTGFIERLNRQITCHHYSAYYLDHTTTT